MKRVMLAVGDKNYSDILKEIFREHEDHFELCQEVLHRNYIEELIEVENPDILIIHDKYLPSDKNTDEERDKELIELVRQLRVTHDDSLRIVLLCERPVGDALLSSFVAMGIMDIFNRRAFDIDEFIQQLKDKPRFSRVEKFLFIPSTQPQMGDEEETEDDEEHEKPETVAIDDTERDVKPETVQPVIKKVVEKKVVKRVVEKNVIKRNYQINIQNQTLKIVGVPVQRKLIMIGSIRPGTGSTFISHLLARILTQLNTTVTYIENPFSPAYTYDRFIGHQKTKDYHSLFYRYSLASEHEREHQYDWEIENVSIICKNPTREPSAYTEEQITFEVLMKVLYSARTTVTIVDVGADWSKEIFKDVFDMADYCYIVIEPDIPFMQYFEDSKDSNINELRSIMKNEKTYLIGNRFTRNLLKNEVIRDLYQEKLIASIPDFSVEDVFFAQFQGIFLNDYIKDFTKKYGEYVEPIIKNLLPEEYLKKLRRQNSLFSRMFKKKKISVQKSDEETADNKDAEGEEATP